MTVSISLDCQGIQLKFDNNAIAKYVPFDDKLRMDQLTDCEATLEVIISVNGEVITSVK